VSFNKKKKGYEKNKTFKIKPAGTLGKLNKQELRPEPQFNDF